MAHFELASNCSYAQLEGFFKHKGVKHETTAPYTPEQNEAAERFNRTLMERVRAMLFDAQQPKDLWAEAAVTATYIKNRSSRNGRAQTPWELYALLDWELSVPCVIKFTV